MATLADLTRQVARLVTRTVIGSTTSAPGNATQIIDTTNLAGLPDNEFVGGTVWITSGTNAGRSRVITAFSNADDRITCAVFPNNILSGVTFEAAAGDFVEYRDLRQAVNIAIRECGYVLDKDETLTIVDDQLIYTLPAGVSKILSVEILEDPTLADEKPKISNHWAEIDGELVFEYGYEPNTIDGTKLRLRYKKFASELASDTDTLNDQLDEDYIVYLAARQAARLSYMRFGRAGKETVSEWLNEAIEEMKKHVRQKQHGPYVRVKPG